MVGYLDTDDHGRLLEENRAAYAQDELEELSRELRQIETAREVVSCEEHVRLDARVEAIEDRMEYLGDIIRWER